MAAQHLRVPVLRVLLSGLLGLGIPACSTKLAQATTQLDPSLRAQRRPAVVATDDSRVIQAPGGSLVTDLQAKREATSSDEIQARALALFAEGRLLFQREQYAEALQRFQRSYFWNPDVRAPLAEIVPLAFHLKDVHVGTRYAVLAAEHDPTQTDLVDPVIAYLSEEQQFERAFNLKRKALAATGPHDEKSAEWVAHQHDLGRLAFLSGHFQEAAESFAVVDDALQKPDQYKLSRAALRAMKRNPEVLYNLMATSFLRSNRIDRAARLFEQVQTLVPNDSLNRYRQAQIAHARGKHEDALRAMQQYLDAGANVAGTEVFDLLRDILQALDRMDDPQQGYVALLEHAGQRGPADPLISFALAEYHREQQRYAQALPLYQVSLDETPTVEAFRGAFECCHHLNDHAALLELLGLFVNGGGDWETLGEVGPQLIENEQLRSKVFTTLEDASAAAESSDGTDAGEGSEPDAASSNFPRAAEWFGGGLMAVAADEPERAAKFFEVAIDRIAQERGSDEEKDHKKGTWTLAAALEFYVSGAYPQAIVWLRRASEQSMESRPDIAHHLATALHLDGQTDAALQVISEALPGGDAAILLKTRQAWINMQGDRTDTAQAICLQLLKDYDSTRDELLVREALKDVRSQLSNLELLAGNDAMAAEWLHQILDEFPEDAGAMNDLGYLWADANKHLHRALQMIEFAVASQPENFAYLDSLGWVLYRLERYEEAVRSLEKAAKMSDDDGVIWDHLGDAYNQLGRRSDAVRAWEVARKAFRESEEADKLKLVEEKIAKGS